MHAMNQTPEPQLSKTQVSKTGLGSRVKAGYTTGARQLATRSVTTLAQTGVTPNALTATGILMPRASKKPPFATRALSDTVALGPAHLRWLGSAELAFDQVDWRHISYGERRARYDGVRWSLIAPSPPTHR
jgi:hypothetical protein